MRWTKQVLALLIVVAGVVWVYTAVDLSFMGTVEELPEAAGPPTAERPITEPPRAEAPERDAGPSMSEAEPPAAGPSDVGQQDDISHVEASGLAYTALGDSLSTGVLSASGYVDYHHAYLQSANGTDVALANLGVNGMTSGQLLEALLEDDAYREAVRTADVITLNIGGNDFMHARVRYKNGTCAEEGCLEAAAAEFKQNWQAIIQEVLALRTVDEATVRTMNVYYPFVGEDKSDATFDLFRPYLDALNEHMCGTAERHDIPCADVYTAFNGEEGDADPVELGYITFDGIHPTEIGHRIIADLLRDLD